MARAVADDVGSAIAVTQAAAVTLPDMPLAPLPDGQAVALLRATMTAHVGVRRTKDGLQKALAEIAVIDATHPDMANMCATAKMIVTAALLRTESRGAHWRDDFPATDPTQATRCFLTLAQATALREPMTQVLHDPALA